MLKTPKASNTNTKSRIPRPTTTNKQDHIQKEESAEKSIIKPEKKTQVCKVQIAKPVKRRNDGTKKVKSPFEEKSVSKKITAVVHQALAVNQALATARKTTTKPRLLSYKVGNDELPDLQAKQGQDEYSTNDVKYAAIHDDKKPVKIDASPQTIIDDAPKLNENIETEICKLSASPTQLQKKRENIIENPNDVIPKKKKKKKEKGITKKTQELLESKPSKTKKLNEIALTEDEKTQGEEPDITETVEPKTKKTNYLKNQIEEPLPQQIDNELEIPIHVEKIELVTVESKLKAENVNPKVQKISSVVEGASETSYKAILECQVSEGMLEKTINEKRELTKSPQFTLEENPTKKKVKKLTKKVKKSRINKNDEIMETEFPLVETINNTARTPSPGSQNLAKISTSILLSPTPWSDRQRSPSPTSRLHTNQSTKESSRNHTPTHQQSKLPTPLPHKENLSNLSQQPTSPKPQQPNARSSVDLEQVLKLFEEKKIPLELSDLVQLLEKSNIPDKESNVEASDSDELKLEETKSRGDLQEFEELEQNMTDPAFEAPEYVSSEVETSDSEDFDGNEVINDTNESNITIQINREDDSQVSEIDSDTGDSEKCEMTDSQEKEDIENEEVEENHKISHVEFAEDYIEESLEEDSNGEVGSGELEIEEANKNIAKIEGQSKPNKKEAFEDKNDEPEEERLNIDDDEKQESEIVEDTETEETDEIETEIETDELPDEPSKNIFVAKLGEKEEESEETEDSSEVEKDKCDNDNFTHKNGNNIESKIDAINSSKENEEEYEDISFNLEYETNAKLDTEITEADGDNLSINRPSSKIGLLLGNIVRSFSPLSFEKYSRPSSKMEEEQTMLEKKHSPCDNLVEKEKLSSLLIENKTISPVKEQELEALGKDDNSSEISKLLNETVQTSGIKGRGALFEVEGDITQQQDQEQASLEKDVEDNLSISKGIKTSKVFAKVEGLESDLIKNIAGHKKMYEKAEADLQVVTKAIDTEESKSEEHNNQDAETTKALKRKENCLSMIDDNESATADLKEALESIQEMKEKMAQLMALITISAPKSPASLQQEHEEMIPSIMATEDIRKPAELVEPKDPSIHVHHVEDLTFDLSKGNLMKESALKQNEVVVAGVSEDPLLPVFEQRKIFELETMRAMINEAEKCSIDLKVSQESVPLKCPIPVTEDKAPDKSISKQFSNVENENVAMSNEEKEDSFDSADREVGEIFIQQTIIIENSSLSNHHYFSTIDDQNEKTDEHNRQNLSNCQTENKSDLYSPKKVEKLLSENNEDEGEVANFDIIADEASNLNLNIEIEDLESDLDKGSIEPTSTVLHGTFEESSDIQKDICQTNTELKAEQLECSFVAKELYDEDTLNNSQEEKDNIENKEPILENLLALDLSKNKHLWESKNCLLDSVTHAHDFTDESKSHSLDNFEMIENTEIENSNKEDLQETQESLSKSEDDELPNITCRLCKERGTKSGSHSHRKSIEDLITFFNLMTHYKNEHQCEPRSRSESIEGRSRRQSSPKLSQFELDLNDKNDQKNQTETGKDIQPKETSLSPPPMDHLKPVYFHPRPCYPTYSRFNQSQQELASNNWLRDDSRNDNIKQSYESLVYPESLMRCKSESNLKKTMKFSVSMKELDTDMLTISFDGDNVNISSSSKVLTQSSIDVKQQGSETIFNVKANPSIQENAEEVKEQFETENKSSQAKGETQKFTNEQGMEMEMPIQSKDESEKLENEEEMEIKEQEKTVENTEAVIIASTIDTEHDIESSSSVDTVIDNRRKSLTERYDIDIPPAKLFYFDRIDIDKEDSGESIEMQKKMREPEEVFVEAPEAISYSESHENIVDLDVSPVKSLDDWDDNEDIISEEMDKELDLIATAKIYQYHRFDPSNEEVVTTQYHTQESKIKPNFCNDVDEEEELLERYYQRGSQQYNRFQRAPIRPGGRHRKFEPILSSPQTSLLPTRTKVCKILFIGSSSTGKTSIIRRYVKKTFAPTYRATIGADFLAKVVKWNENLTLRLQLWDIAGQDRFSLLSRSFYKDAAGAFIVSDLSRAETLDAVISWKEELDNKVRMADGSKLPCFLLANKCDLLEDSSHQSKQHCKIYQQYGFRGWIQTSAKEDINISEAMALLLRIIVENEMNSTKEVGDLNENVDNASITLEPVNGEDEKKKKASGCRC